MGTIRITVDFYQPRFHGLDVRGHLEWPPKPPRVAGALMAGCHLPTADPDAVAALRALTALPNPVIHAPRTWPAELPDTYTHRTGGPLKSSTLNVQGLGEYLDATLAGLSATNRVPKPTRHTVLGGCRVVYEVEDPRGTVDVAALDRAARRVPYLGRSQDACDISVRAFEREDHDADADAVTTAADDADDADPTPVTWRPHVDAAGKHRGWSPTLCDWMDLNHEATVSGGQIPAPPIDPHLVRLTYTRVSHGTPPRRGTDAEAPLVVVPFGRSLASHAVPRLFERLGIPALLAEAPGLVAFPAVFAGHEHADGALHGIGLAARDESVLSAAVARVSRERGQIDEERQRPLRTLEARTWLRSSTDWVSATPLRAFPDLRVASHVIGENVLRATGQAPTITWSKQPEEPWQSRWRQPPDGLDLWWAEIAFEEPVSGPLLLGASTDLGFGLFVPFVRRAEGE